MDENLHYSDLINAHKIFCRVESRWKFYDSYMQNKDFNVWFESADIPIKEGLLLFGFIQSWDPNFQGDFAKFLLIYKKIFQPLKKLNPLSLTEINLNNEINESISSIFTQIANCPRKKRFESTDASKILHTILPNFFVMWDTNIRDNIVDKRKDGQCYAFEFLPKMQLVAKEYLDSYVKENGGDYKKAVFHISSATNNYTLPKVIDEYNYVRYTKGISLTEIRNYR